MRKWISSLLAAAIAAAACANALAGISPGAKLVGTIDQTINSKTAQVGMPFTLSNAHTTNYDINGATVYGHVRDVRRAGQGTRAEIVLAVDKVNTRSGNIYKISGYTTNVQANTKSNAGKEAGAAVGGALIGSLIGPASAVIAGTGGYLLAKNSRQNITIPSGSLVTVEITESRRQASHP